MPKIPTFPEHFSTVCVCVCVLPPANANTKSGIFHRNYLVYFKNTPYLLYLYNVLSLHRATVERGERETEIKPTLIHFLSIRRDSQQRNVESIYRLWSNGCGLLMAQLSAAGLVYIQMLYSICTIHKLICKYLECFLRKSRPIFSMFCVACESAEIEFSDKFISTRVRVCVCV